MEQSDFAKNIFDEPFTQISAEGCGFTLWWPDLPRGKSAHSQSYEHSLLGDDHHHTPEPSDLRVRVQAEVTEDFARVTFFIDAGKPWNRAPVVSAQQAIDENVAGVRRTEIFNHVENVRSICEKRLKPNGSSLVDEADFPEKICTSPPELHHDLVGKTMPEIDADAKLSNLWKQHVTNTEAWQEAEETAAERLLKAADYLYDGIWNEFCSEFGFNLCDIVGNTSEVFANFRGLVIAAHGMEEPKDDKSFAAPATYGTKPFPRFDAESSGYSSSKVEPNAVVKAFMPFMRRFRSEGDWREWIACGIFDWRGIYITPLGSKSEYRSDEEGRLSKLIQAKHLPPRRKRDFIQIDARQVCADFINANGDSGPEHAAPQTLQSDRPAPSRYLLLTKYAPHRKQIGRMIERINTTGSYRLYALKNWTVLEQAGILVRVFGQQLDEAYLQWITNTRKTRDIYENNRKILWGNIQIRVQSLTDDEEKKSAEEALAHRAINEERSMSLMMNLHSDQIKQGQLSQNWMEIYTFLQGLRDEKEKRDIDLAKYNVAAEHALVGITSALDELGKAAIGGISYRVSRSRFYAQLFRETANLLRTGNIETWWSYSQFAKRSMEPSLRFVESVGIRIDKLRQRLQNVKQDILQSSISNQTEATRDNTHKLERIQEELRLMTTESKQLNTRVLKLQALNEEIKTQTSLIERAIIKISRIHRIVAFIFAALGWLLFIYNAFIR